VELAAAAVIAAGQMDPMVSFLVKQERQLPLMKILLFYQVMVLPVDMAEAVILVLLVAMVTLVAVAVKGQPAVLVLLVLLVVLVEMDSTLAAAAVMAAVVMPQ
jgi:hypothetical protein